MTDTPPKKVPWLDEVKRTKRLTLFFDDSLGQTGWDKIFKDAIVEFNKMTANYKIGVTFAKAEEGRSKANVEALAKKGDFKTEFPSDFPYDVPTEIKNKTIRFDDTTAHGHCSPFLTQVEDHAKVLQYKLVRAFIYVPATPIGPGQPSRAVGDPVKLVIAVHELIHACGIVHNDEHSVDDVFCWPRISMGATPNDDRLQAYGGEYTFPGKPGEPPRVGHKSVDMPPIFLKKETCEKLRKLWA